MHQVVPEAYGTLMFFSCEASNYIDFYNRHLKLGEAGAVDMETKSQILCREALNPKPDADPSARSPKSCFFDGAK